MAAIFFGTANDIYSSVFSTGFIQRIIRFKAGILRSDCLLGNQHPYTTSMKKRNIFFASLAWFQLAISLLLAAVIIWGYASFQATFGQFISSLAASVGAVSTVVVRTAETVEARQDMLNETQKMLVVT